MTSLSIAKLAEHIRGTLITAWTLALVLYIVLGTVFVRWQVEALENRINQATVFFNRYLSEGLGQLRKADLSQFESLTIPSISDSNANLDEIKNPILQPYVNLYSDRLFNMRPGEELVFLDNLSDPLNSHLIVAQRTKNKQTIKLAVLEFSDERLMSNGRYLDLMFTDNQRILSTSATYLSTSNMTCQGLSVVNLFPVVCRNLYLKQGFEILLIYNLSPLALLAVPAFLIFLFLILVLVRQASLAHIQLKKLRNEFGDVQDRTDDLVEFFAKHSQDTEGALKNLRKIVNQLESVQVQYQENQNLLKIMHSFVSTSEELFRSLQHTQEEFGHLAELTPVGILAFNENGQVTSINPAAGEITGRSLEELADEGWQDVLYPGDRHTFKTNWRQLIAENLAFSCELRVVRHLDDVRLCHFDTVIQESEIPNDSFGPDMVKVRRFVGTLTDVTEQKKIEQALSQSEARWQFALDGSDQGVWDWNIDSGTTYFSDKWAAMVGLRPQDLESNINQWHRLIHPEDLETVNAAINNHLGSISELFNCEHRLKTSEGAYIWFLAKGKVVERDAFGRPIRMIGTHTDISDRKLKEAHIHHLAYHDQLTSLPNRMLLKEEVNLRLSIVKRYDKHGALLFLDLDRFKLVNDSMGHHKGDQLLKQVAKRLSSCIRSGDLLARIGGDEFVILLGQQSDDRHQTASNAHQMAEKILDTVSYSFDLGGHVVTSGASIGITIYPSDGSTYEELLKHADTAMYQAKKQGRNCFHFYEKELEDEVQANLRLENDLRRAIQENELLMYYQPKVDLVRGTVRGAEALVRWQTPDGNIVSPADFIPIAEETGLIIPLGDWVIDSVFAQMNQWSSEAEYREIDRVALNVSPQQLRDNAFIGRVEDALAKYPNLRGTVEFEITEGAFIHNLEETCSRMEKLRSLGISFAVDDFGTGYSSLAYLKRLPVDVLKVDRAFIRDIETDSSDASLVRATVSMAKSLELMTVAEGVENEIQLAFLQEAGCDYYQGYLFSPPKPAKEFWQLVKENNRKPHLQKISS